MSHSKSVPSSVPKDSPNPVDRFSVENYQRPVLETPNGSRKIVLHTCCAPCSAEVMDALVASKIATTVFFYNPNIHPRDEYKLRKAENARYAEKLGMAFIDADYDAKNWFNRVEGLEQEPERGKRCTVCFDMRFERTAAYAAAHGFNLFASTLGISRWKNMDQVNESGVRAAARFPGMQYWDFNWRKQGGSQRKIEITKAEQFYQQDYCGCVYSLRDANEWRQSKGLEKIQAKVESQGQDGLAGEEG